MTTVHFKVDGQTVHLDSDPSMPLLYALRDELNLKNPKFGCGLGQCGACTVHIDGVATRSCVTPMAALDGKAVTTLQGLGSAQKPHPVQAAFVAEQVPQCGYCINGWVMTAAALLRDKPRATDAEIRTALGDLKCRCGTHVSMLRAIKRAQAEMLNA